jgi:ankyrin repeat protein
MRKNGTISIIILSVFLVVFALMAVYIYAINLMEPLFTMEDMQQAVLTGDFEKFEEIYTWNPALLFIFDNYDNTLLHLAVKQNNFEMVKLLTERGLLANQANRFGNSPLSIAVINGNLEIAEHLLHRNFDPNAEYIKGIPLLLAVNANDAKMVELLLSKKADPNIDDGEPLLRAAANDNIEIARTLVYSGAIANGSRNHNARRPLCEAARNGNISMATFLIGKGARVNARSGYFGRTCLHTAAERGHLEMVIFLLNQGANPDIQDYSGAKPIDYARRESYIGIVRILKPRTTEVVRHLPAPQKEEPTNEALQGTPQGTPQSTPQSTPSPKRFTDSIFHAIFGDR